jgi:hypothetical protein
MDLSPEQRQALADNCLLTSWQTLSHWRLQHLGSLHNEPDIMLDWLAHTHHRSLALREEMLRFMTDQLWHIDLQPVSAARTVQAPNALNAPIPSLQPLVVACSGQCWTLWLRPLPQLHVHHITPSTAATPY